jgi:uncharacterized SAM-binding protein YcdF (DUF218 family)
MDRTSPTSKRTVAIRANATGSSAEGASAPGAGEGKIACGKKKAAMGGIFVRKERWGLSWRGRLLALGLFAVVGGILVLGIYPFLAVTKRVPAHILVMEGWVHGYCVQTAIDEFHAGNYPCIYTTGGPVSGQGGYINDFMTSASVGAGLLREAGLPANQVQMVPSRVSDRDRTYNAAVALCQWFEQHHQQVEAINVVTEGPHARRTWLLYKKAFGDDVQIGIIAASNPDFDPKRWWRYSEGVREVVDEAVAYTYARLLFRKPPAESN